MAIKIKITSTFRFNKAIAKKFCKVKYYEAQAKNQRKAEYIDAEKVRLSTPRWEKITELIEGYKSQAVTTKSSTGKVLLGIYKKNCGAAKNKQIATNSKLMSILCKPETLLLAYQSIKGNKGALTEASIVSADTYNNFDAEQKYLYTKSLTFRDKISLYDFFTITHLLRRGKYPWGTSLRIYIPKPGVLDKQRPLTIPPFMDRVVQKAMSLIMEAIYEPYFETTNRSFGFRPNKGTLDAITAVNSRYTSGMRTAIEGDIEAAYDTVDKNKLINCLRKRIKDEKFLKLIASRLDYEYLDTKSDKRVKPEKGIPQGGVDSPYLWNIYMMEFDDFTHKDLQTVIDDFNKKTNYKRASNRQFTSLKATRKKLLRYISKAKIDLKKRPLGRGGRPVLEKRNELYKLIKEVRLYNHKKNWVSSATDNKKVLRIFYVRYADDWILLTNGGREIAQVLKEKIATYLFDYLGLKLSESKTIITNLRKDSAHFLGFEFRCSARGRLRHSPIADPNSKKRHTLSKASAVTLWCQPDRQRMINRYHMKGLCDKNGFPLGLPWMSCLEPQVIIDRTNAVLRGVANFYLPTIRNRAKIHRWIYIIRFSCLKTLAQKYRCTISKIFKRFGSDMFSKATQTVVFKVNQVYKKKTFTKEWKLLTYKSLVDSIDYKGKRKEMLTNFFDCEYGNIGNYLMRVGSFPKVTNTDYLDTLTWVSWRTSANFNMPCAYCGTFEKVHIHHLKHVRKTAYSLIPHPKSYTQIMALRNRKQIPFCETHHLQYVHNGKYNGPALIKLLPKSQRLVDNRIHLSSFIKSGFEYTAKTLVEKGWKEVSEINKI